MTNKRTNKQTTLPIWIAEWVSVLPSAAGADHIAHCPGTVGFLVKWVAFLGSLHWLAGGANLVVGGVSYVELLILYEPITGGFVILGGRSVDMDLLRDPGKVPLRLFWTSSCSFF